MIEMKSKVKRCNKSERNVKREREQQEMKANVYVWREERIAKARMDKSRPSANK